MNRSLKTSILSALKPRPTALRRARGGVFIALSLIAAAAVYYVPRPTSAADGGILDPTFDGDGKVTTGFVTNTRANDVVIQPDGKIIVVGGDDSVGFRLARYNPNGALDASFDGDGLALIGINGGTGYSVVLQPDGKIVIGGEGEGGFALARLNPNGSRDMSFGTNGVVITLFTQFNNQGFDVALQPDGKIIVVGQVFQNGNDSDFALVRYNADGSPDTSFDGDGRVITSFGAVDSAEGIALQPDGKIVVAGYANIGGRDNFAIARYNADGALDTAFDGDGKVTTAVSGGNNQAFAVTLQADSKIVAAGGDGNNFGLARYLPNGALDTLFGGDGTITTAFSGFLARAQDVLVQPDGKIVASGGLGNFFLTRYDPDGALDANFGSGGRAITDFAPTGVEQASSIALQSDGKIIAAGFTTVGSRTGFALARYGADLPLTPTPTATPTPTPTPTATPPPPPNTFYRIGGRVTDGTGFPISSVVISLSGSASNFAATDQDGRYSFPDLPAGETYTVTPSAAGITFAPPSRTYANLSADQTAADFTIIFPPTPTPTPTPPPCTPRVEACLDATFSGDGKVSGANGAVSAAVLQADGKIVIVGGQAVSDGVAISNFILERYNPDGSRDASFNGNGTVSTNFFDENSSSEDFARAIVIQPDGKIVVAGSTSRRPQASVQPPDFALARYNPDGSLDTSFGTGGADGDGKVTTDFLNNSSDDATALILQPDGKLVAFGSGSPGFALARYNADGSLDATFGAGGADGDGKVTTGFSERVRTSAAVLQPDGKIVVTGSVQTGVSSDFIFDFALARYNADGSLDSSFDSDGKLTTDFGDSDEAFSVALQPDGRIVAVGRRRNPDDFSSDFALARYNPNGSLDVSFDSDGKAITDFSSFDSANYIALQSDGKLLVAGGTETCRRTDMALARYNADGSLDTGFNSGGLATINFISNNNFVGADNFDTASAVIIQPDGKLIAAGTTSAGTNISTDFSFALARYSDGVCPAPTPTPPPAPTPAPTPLSGEKIAFSSNRDLNFNREIYVMRPTGADQTRVTNNPGADSQPSLSPDGTRIAFVSTRDGNSEIYVMDANGANQTRLTNSAGSDNSEPNYSSDGQRIVFTSSRDRNNEIYVMNADGSNQTRLTGNLAADIEPSFSPDGQRLVFTRNISGSTDIYVMNVDGSNETRLTNNAQFDRDESPGFSPDGTRIVFTGSRGNQSSPDIYIMNADGSNQSRLTNTRDNEEPSFSPDSTRIAFASTRTNDFEIYVMNADGSNVTRLTNNTASDNEPDWGGAATTPTPTPTVTPNPSPTVTPTPAITPTPSPTPIPASTVQFSAAMSSGTEDYAAVVLTVTRSGDADAAVSVEYESADASARQRTDFSFASGKLTFAPGETSKAFTLLVNKDSYTEDNETLTIMLVNPQGAALGATATVTINILDDSAETNANPIDATDGFVQQHYHDFLARRPDAGGLAFWTNQIDGCAPQPQCRDTQRIEVSAQFFISQEFQDTGFFVYGLYRAAYGTLAVPNSSRANVTYLDFMHDRNRVIGGGDMAQQRVALANEFITRMRFVVAYPTTLTNAEFVNRLFDNASLTPFTAERQAELDAMNNQGRTRAQVLQNVVNLTAFRAREYNAAFVLAQYFDYLRRDPDQAGYDYWLNALNQSAQRYRQMVCNFITSREYQERFGSQVTRTNAQCGAVTNVLAP